MTGGMVRGGWGEDGKWGEDQGRENEGRVGSGRRMRGGRMRRMGGLGRAAPQADHGIPEVVRAAAEARTVRRSLQGTKDSVH